MIGFFLWSLVGLIIILIWQRVAPPQWKIGARVGEASGISVFSGVFSALLTLTIIFLFNQIWNDLANFVQSPAVTDRASMDLDSIIIHTIFVVSVLIVAFVVALALHSRGTKFAVITLPYFIGSTDDHCASSL